MEWYKDKKVIGISILVVIVLVVALITYGKNQGNIFKDQYKDNIFVEENELTTSVSNDDLSSSKSTEEQINKIVVEIKGEVKRPDVYILPEGSIIKDLIDEAGGLTSEANVSKLNRARKLQNHELIIIGNINEQNSDDNENNIIEETSNSKVVSLNTATLDQLKTIPGIGDVKANSIISYREKNGGFKKIDELKNIDGIGEKTFDKIKDYISL